MSGIIKIINITKNNPQWNYFVAGFLSLAIAIYPKVATAQNPFRYNYLEIGYGKSSTEVQGSTQQENDSDSLLPGFQASYAVQEHIAIQAGYEPVRDSFNGLVNGIPVVYNVSGNYLSAGVDLHQMISARSEVGLDIWHNHTKSSGTMSVAGNTSPILSSANISNSISFRARTAVTPSLWFLASMGRTTGGNYAASTDYTAGAQYVLNTKFIVGIEYDLSTLPTGNYRGYIINGQYCF